MSVSAASSEVVFHEMPHVPGRVGQSFFFDPAWLAPCHFHQNPEFNLVLGGRASYFVAGETLNVTDGALLWFASGVAHGILSASRDFRMRAMQFERAFAERVPTLAPQSAHNVSVLDTARQLSESDVAALDERCAALPRVEWPCFAGPPERTAEVFRMAKLAFAAGTRLLGSPRHRAVARAAELLDRDTRLDRQTLAQRVGLSQAELSRRFEQGLGTSLPVHRNRLRVGRVADLWSRGERNLTHAAFEAGFGSYSQFHRVFVELTGCAPREYFSQAMAAHWSSRCAPLAVER